MSLSLHIRLAARQHCSLRLLPHGTLLLEASHHHMPADLAHWQTHIKKLGCLNPLGGRWPCSDRQTLLHSPLTPPLPCAEELQRSSLSLPVSSLSHSAGLNFRSRSSWIGQNVRLVLKFSMLLHDVKHYLTLSLLQDAAVASQPAIYSVNIAVAQLPSIMSLPLSLHHSSFKQPRHFGQAESLFGRSICT